MANLAIRGHIKHGWRAIKLLEMLGGVNQFNLDGNTDAWYVLTDTGVIRWSEWLFGEKGFTIEEFFEKFPYKIGDRVRVPEYESEVRISKMYWDGNEVHYEIITDEVEWYSAKELNEFNEPNKEETMEEIIKIDIPKGYEFAGVDDDKQHIIFEKIGNRYPKTYKECCEVLGCKADDFFTSFGYNGCEVEISYYEDRIDDLLQNFRKLIYCRDAYWTIIGKQMGLVGPWKPDWSTEGEVKYVIEVYRNNVRTNSQGYSNTILAFPTAEIRDIFLENFGHLIELCRKLL